MLGWILLFATVGSPHVDSVDVVELNHCYSDDWSQRRFADQVILWRYNHEFRRLEVAEWVWLDEVDLRICGDRAEVWRLVNGRWQFVRGAWRESWTNYDPEVRDRRLCADRIAAAWR